MHHISLLHLQSSEEVPDLQILPVCGGELQMSPDPAVRLHPIRNVCPGHDITNDIVYSEAFMVDGYDNQDPEREIISVFYSFSG